MIPIEVKDLIMAKQQCSRIANIRQERLYVAKCTGIVCNRVKCLEGCYVIVDSEHLNKPNVGKVEYDTARN